MDLAAVDLGNESGRVMRVTYSGGSIECAEVYRFPNNPVTVRGTLHWDLLRLWHEIEVGLRRAQEQPLAGIGVDSFGVDFGLLDVNDQLIGNPVHMRDGRTEGMMEWVLERVPRQTLWERSGGIGFYIINSLYQLAALTHQAPYQLDAARSFLTIPNLLNFWLTGEKQSEFTHTTTTQCYNPLAGDWDKPTLEALGIPTRMFPPVIQPGERLGSYNHVPVFTVASHDTGSAVLAVPTETPHFAYISSGTWSLFGIETPQPLTNPAALEANLTSEGGAFGTFRPLKMVMGLWILQQCRAAWAHQGWDTDYARLIAQAEAAPPFVSLIDPDDASFFPPGDMPGRVHDFCVRTGQPAPQEHGAVVRCVMESLALKYRHVVEQLIAAGEHPIDVIHIVGGGAQNALLCQMAADATGRPVLAGPVEATALGNGLAQLIALGELKDVAEARALIRRSHPPVRYEPQAGGDWSAAYERFRGLMTAP
jgi:rhamnulokinase